MELCLAILRVADKAILCVEGYQGWIPGFLIEEGIDEPVWRNYYVSPDYIMLSDAFVLAELTQEGLDRAEFIGEEEYIEIVSGIQC